MFFKYYLFLIELVLVLAVVFRKGNRIASPFFIGFILLTFLVEVYAIVLMDYYDANNLWLYNIFLIVSFVCWFFWFKLYSSLKRVVLIVLSIYSIVAVLDILFFQKLMSLNSYSYLTGTFGYVVLFFIWMRDLLRDEKHVVQNDLLIFFTGGLGYFTGLTIDIVLYPTGLLSKKVYADISLDTFLINTVNTFFYGMLSLAIVVSYKLGNKKIRL